MCPILDVTYCFRSTLLMALILMLSKASGDMVITECLWSLERCSDILWLIAGLNPSHQWGNNPLSAEGNSYYYLSEYITIVLIYTEWKSHSVNICWVIKCVHVCMTRLNSSIKRMVYSRSIYCYLFWRILLFYGAVYFQFCEIQYNFKPYSKS